MQMSHIPRRYIQNKNVHSSFLNGVLWDMEQAYCKICEMSLFIPLKARWMAHGGVVNTLAIAFGGETCIRKEIYRP